MDLGYSGPPFYWSPVAVSIADAYIKAEKYDQGIETYNADSGRYRDFKTLYYPKEIMMEESF